MVGWFDAFFLELQYFQLNLFYMISIMYLYQFYILVGKCVDDDLLWCVWCIFSHFKKCMMLWILSAANRNNSLSLHKNAIVTYTRTNQNNQ